MSRASIIITATLALSSLFGCGGSSAQTGDIELDVSGADQAQLFNFTAQPDNHSNPGIVSAVVTINEIDAKVDGKWAPLVTAPQTIDLLKLDNKSISTLGVVKIPTGHVSELRFQMDQIGDYVVDKSGDKKPLMVPDSGSVKVEGKLDLDTCAAGVVIVDFDPHIIVQQVKDGPIFELTCNAKIKTDDTKGACGNTAGPDMAGGGGMDPCSNVVCMMNQVCVVQNGAPVCVATCNNVVCPAPEVCVVDNGTPTCETPGGGPADMGHGGGGGNGGGGGGGPADMAGGCHH